QDDEHHGGHPSSLLSDSTNVRSTWFRVVDGGETGYMAAGFAGRSPRGSGPARRMLRFYYEMTTARQRAVMEPRPRGPRGPPGSAVVAVEVAQIAQVGRPPVGAAAAAGLLPQGDVADGHGPVGRLAHVVDGEARHRHRGERLHLHARAVDGVDLGLHLDVGVLDPEVD